MCNIMLVIIMEIMLVLMSTNVFALSDEDLYLDFTTRTDNLGK